jgi:hypothetical protein
MAALSPLTPRLPGPARRTPHAFLASRGQSGAAAQEWPEEAGVWRRAQRPRKGCVPLRAQPGRFSRGDLQPRARIGWREHLFRDEVVGGLLGPGSRRVASRRWRPIVLA